MASLHANSTTAFSPDACAAAQDFVTDTRSRPRIVRGTKAVLRLRECLVRLAARTGQTGAMDDLEFFLSLPQSRAKEACLVVFPLLESFEEDAEDAGEQEISAAVLLFQYCILGLGCRIYSTADTTGRRTVIAPEWERSRYVAAAAACLFEEGAQIALFTLQQGSGTAPTELAARERLVRFSGARWAVESREIPLYLRLESTMDGTLALIGQRTRSNLRYYRRRCERDLGCVFVPDAELSMEEFLEFNRLCKYSVAEKLARWRFRSREIIHRPFLHGVRDRDGRWLALVCGRRYNDAVEIDWQSNRADLPAYSLSTVIRSYLIEHEIGKGSKRLYIEGGTPNPIQQSFVTEQALDLTVVRRTLYTRAIRRLSPKSQFPKNHVSQVIGDPHLTWHGA